MEEDSEYLRETLFGVIENQIKENDPPITSETFERLRKEGFSREETMKHIGCALSVELFEIMKNKELFNLQRYTLNLKNLPQLPWDE